VFDVRKEGLLNAGIAAGMTTTSCSVGGGVSVIDGLGLQHMLG